MVSFELSLRISVSRNSGQAEAAVAHANVLREKITFFMLVVPVVCLGLIITYARDGRKMRYVDVLLTLVLSH